jgi:Uma2 family endonuclease
LVSTRGIARRAGAAHTGGENGAEVGSMVAERQRKLLMAEQYAMLPEPLNTRHELVRGELVEVGFASVVHAVIVSVLYDALKPFVVARGLGVVFGDGVGCITTRNPDTVRGPDLSFVAADRVPSSGFPSGYWPFAPDLAVEVVSPNERMSEVQDRVREYLAAGSRLVWVLRPTRRTATAYSADGLVREFKIGDVLDGGDVVPGFRVAVAELFAVAG